MNQAFKVARITQALRQKDLAEMVGVSEHMICLIETGRRIPPVELQEKLAKILQRPRFELFRDCGKGETR